jgi:hypothetical protein
MDEMSKVLGFLGSLFSIFSTILMFKFLYKREKIKTESEKNTLLGEKLAILRLIYEMREVAIFTDIEVEKMKKQILINLKF